MLHLLMWQRNRLKTKGERKKKREKKKKKKRRRRRRRRRRREKEEEKKEEAISPGKITKRIPTYKTEKTPKIPPQPSAQYQKQVHFSSSRSITITVQPIPGQRKRIKRNKNKMLRGGGVGWGV